MLQPKEIPIELADGTVKTFIISKFPAIAGREIVTQYPISGMPKLGDYKVNEQIMLSLMCFVAVKTEGGSQALLTKELVNNHVPDWESLAKIELAMMEYNCSFFRNGKISGFFETIKAQLPQLITSILTDLSGQSSQQKKQPSKSSKKRTH